MLNKYQQFVFKGDFRIKWFDLDIGVVMLNLAYKVTTGSETEYIDQIELPVPTTFPAFGFGPTFEAYVHPMHLSITDEGYLAITGPNLYFYNGTGATGHLSLRPTFWDDGQATFVVAKESKKYSAGEQRQIQSIRGSRELQAKFFSDHVFARTPFKAAYYPGTALHYAIIRQGSEDVIIAEHTAVNKLIESGKGKISVFLKYSSFCQFYIPLTKLQLI